MVFEPDHPRPVGDLAQLNQPVVGMMTIIAVTVVAFQEIARLAQLIEITEVNVAAASLVGASDRMNVFGRLDPVTFTEASLASLIPQPIAVWEGRDRVVSEVRHGRTLQGERLEGLLSWTVPRVDGQLDLSQTVVAIVDVTDSRMANEQLEALVESKDELIAAVSHELRTPLTTVVGLSEELRESFDDFETDELREFVGLVAAQSVDLAIIVEDLLAAALAEAGSLHIELEPVNATAEVMATLRSLGLEDAISIEFVPGLGPILADAGRLRQIIRNLIVNAQRYGRDPIRVVVRGTGDTMMLEIRDSGPQLPIEQQRAIFDRYHRAGQRPGVAASVGVGLTVSRELARAMGGDVTYGHDGETVFTLSLPCATVPVGPAVGSRLTETSHLAG